MTREEAKGILEGDNLNRSSKQEKEALNMAIEALEQEPCEDCISRAEALKLVQNKNGYVCPTDFLTLPSVQPVRKKGNWISNGDMSHCSECGQIIFSVQNWFKCCPKCMADMREGEKINVKIRRTENVYGDNPRHRK